MPADPHAGVDDAGRQLAQTFWRQSYVVLKGVFGADEVAVLKDAIAANALMAQRVESVRRKTAEGKYPSFETIFVWNDTSGDDLFARFTRRERIFTALETIFDDEPYVYHNKVALKYDGIPGFKFHQDYWYWYKMGCLWPDLATAFIALDPATRANGCLKIVEGSHRLGRLEHVLNDGVSDSEVDPERLELILQRLPVRHIELDPGDCVLFHCNALHGSDMNTSGNSRIALLGCYNTSRNDPVVRSHEHPNFVLQSRFRERVSATAAYAMPDFYLSCAEAD